MFQSPTSVFFHIGSFEIKFYSLFMALSIIAGAFVTWWITKKYYPYIGVEFAERYTPPVVIGAIIGARLWYVILCWEYFSKHPAEIFMMRNGGLTIHGAIAGGVLVGYIMTKFDKKSFIECCDCAPWGVLVGQIIGRWGNFFNSEAFGLPTNLPWKLYIPPTQRPIQFINYEYFHPTFLYESLWNIFVFCLLFFVFRKLFKNIRGGIFFMYLILYSIGRILIENIRIDSVSFTLGIPTPTFVSLSIILISTIFLLYIIKNADKFKTM